nr:PREDICTED: guanylate-binding protein 7-like [Equus przewalskii]
MWTFSLAVLLSSVFVYNSMGTINHQALEQLQDVTELTKLIRTRSSPISGEVDDSAECASFFPDFVWDFTLELHLDGHPITDDEYLENALKLIPVSGLQRKSGKPHNIGQLKYKSSDPVRHGEVTAPQKLRRKTGTSRHGAKLRAGNALGLSFSVLILSVLTGDTIKLSLSLKELAQY